MKATIASLVAEGCTYDRVDEGMYLIAGNSARNGNLEVPVYLLKAKRSYTARKMKKKQ
jgi:hypothetical protein